MLLKIASVEREYEKDSKLQRKDVQALLNWAEKQPHLPEATELQAILFLQSCYYSLEKAKKALDQFFSLRMQYSDIFHVDMSDEFLKITMKNNLCSVLPVKTPEGYTIILKKYLDTDLKGYNFKSHLTFFDMVFMAHLDRNGGSKGYVVILDFEGGTFSHFTKLNLMAAKKYFYYLQEGMPIRLKMVHFVNIVSFMDKVMAVIKPLFNKEFCEMFHFYKPGAIEGLFEYVPKSCLPLEYGGEAPSVHQLHDKVTRTLVESQELYDSLQKQTVDESLRPAGTKINQNFGLEGSFKKLDID